MVKLVKENLYTKDVWGYKESMEIKDSPKRRPIELAKQGSYGFTNNLKACHGHAGVCSRYSANKLFLLSCFCGTPKCGIRCVRFWGWMLLRYFSYCWVACSILLWTLLIYLVVCCFVIFGCCLLKAFSFQKGYGEVVDLGKKGVVGGSWENWREGKLIGKYCIREESMFNLKKKFSISIIYFDYCQKSCLTKI